MHVFPKSDMNKLVNDFGNYFVHKIAAIRSGFSDCHVCDHSGIIDQSDCRSLNNSVKFDRFDVLSEEDVRDRREVV